MFRVITKKHKHTRRRGTMRKKNPTMRRRHSSHLKHSRRNLHKSRSRRGGGGKGPDQAFTYGVKFAKGVFKAHKEAKRQAEIERRQQEGREIRKGQKQLQTFPAHRGSVITIIPVTSAAPAASAASARFSTPGVSSAELAELNSRASMASQLPLSELVPQELLATRRNFSSREKSSSRRGSLPPQ